MVAGAVVNVSERVAIAGMTKWSKKQSESIMKSVEECFQDRKHSLRGVK